MPFIATYWPNVIQGVEFPEMACARALLWRRYAYHPIWHFRIWYDYTRGKLRFHWRTICISHSIAIFRSWPMKFHGTTSATQLTSSSNFPGGRCPHVPKILRPAQEVWMTVYGSWSRAAGQPLKRDLRREIFLLSLDKNHRYVLLYPYCCRPCYRIAYLTVWLPSSQVELQVQRLTFSAMWYHPMQPRGLRK
jgi:hypothetical protein